MNARRSITPAAAQSAANHDLIASYSGCKAPFVLADSGQNPDGTWFAEVKVYRDS